MAMPPASARKALSEELNRARFEQETAARQVRETIDKTFAAYVIGKQRVSAAQQQVNSNDRLVKQYREEYKLAKRSLLDLLDFGKLLYLTANSSLPASKRCGCFRHIICRRQPDAC